MLLIEEITRKLNELRTIIFLRMLEFLFSVIFVKSLAQAVTNLNRRLHFQIDVLSFLNHCLCERAESWERVQQREREVDEERVED